MAKIFNNSAFFSGLLNTIFKEADLGKTLLSDYLAENLLAQICKNHFSEHKILKNLLKSPAFFKELHTIFSNFTLNSIPPEELLNAAENLEKTDKERLLPIINTYEKYQKILIQNDFLDNASACGFLLENIDKIENYKTSEPVFVSKFNELGEKQIELLEKLYEKADEALYEVKREQKNGYKIYEGQSRV